MRAGVEASGDQWEKHIGHPAWVDEQFALLTWNCYGRNILHANQFRESGGRHIVIENGYLQTDAEGEPMYAMAFDGFAGRGHHPVPSDGGRRWASFGVPIKDWRKSGNHILICGQRGGTYSDLSMPTSWPADVMRRLRAVTDRWLVYRAHPARPRAPSPDEFPPRSRTTVSDRSIDADLVECHAVVTWASNCATEAVLAGVPVFYEGPSIAVKALAGRDIAEIESPPMMGRAETFHALAWALWRRRELSDGTAWRHLMYGGDVE